MGGGRQAVWSLLPSSPSLPTSSWAGRAEEWVCPALASQLKIGAFCRQTLYSTSFSRWKMKWRGAEEAGERGADMRGETLHGRVCWQISRMAGA